MLFYIKNRGGDPRNHSWREVSEYEYDKASKENYFKKEVKYAKQKSEDKEKKEKKVQDHYIGQFTLNDEETVLTIIRRGTVLIAGGTTNCGLIEEHEFTVDDSFSIDYNMQLFIDEINTKETT